jgi:Flp pilus assembly protein TadG
MLAALLAPILLGMVGMALDLGSYAGHKRRLQNASDAVALAAADRMCLTTCSDTSAATTAANTWAAKNNVSTSDMTLVFSGGDTAPKVKVTINANHDFAFMRILGISNKNVAASAAAVKVSPGGIGGLMPWAVTQAAIDATTSGQTLTLHGGSQSPGNFGGFDIDGVGGNVYRDTIKYGSSGIACSVHQPECNATSCPGSYPSQCAENAASCTGPVCPSETGLKTGPTDQGTSYRLSLTSPQCDSFSEAFTTVTAYHRFSEPTDEDLALASDSVPSGGGKLFSPPLAPALKQPTATDTPVPPTPTNTPVPPTPTNTPVLSPTATSTPAGTTTPGPLGTKYGMNPACNPWGAGACPVPDDGVTLCSRRVILIPIIDAFGNGKKDATVQGFALFFLESASGADVTGRFVRADISIAGLAGAYNPNSLIQSSKLSE